MGSEFFSLGGSIAAVDVEELKLSLLEKRSESVLGYYANVCILPFITC